VADGPPRPREDRQRALFRWLQIEERKDDQVREGRRRGVYG